MFNATLETGALFDAAERNDIETVKIFIEEKGAPLTITNDLQQTLAHVAAKKGYLSLVQYLLEKDPSIVKNDEEYLDTLLQSAVESDAFDVVKYMVERHNADISKGQCPVFRTTALHTAVKFNRLKILKYFIEEKNGNVNLVDWQDIPLVFFAVNYQHRDVFDYLAEERHANLTMLDRDQGNILYVTVRNDDLDMMKHLIDEKKVDIDIDWRDNGGETLVHKAVVYNRTEILEYLVGEKHANVNIPDNWHFQTSLHYAAFRNRYNMCKYLIEHGADTQFKDERGYIPVESASDESLIEYMKKVSKVNRRRRRGVVLPDYFAFKKPIPKGIPTRQSLLHRNEPSFEIKGRLEQNTEISSSDFHGSSAFLDLLTMSATIVKSVRFTKRLHQLRHRILEDSSFLEDVIDELHL